MGVPDLRPGAPRLVVSDLDGTFLQPDGTVSAMSRAVLQRAHDAGLRVIFATGRPPRWLDVVEGLPMVDPVVVASNGALLWDLTASTAVVRHDVPSDAASAVVAEVRAAVPGTAFGVEQGLRFGFEPAYAAPLASGHSRHHFQATIDELLAEPFVKLLIQNASLSSEQLAVRVRPIVGGRLTVTHSTYGEVGLLEMSAPGVTKAKTLAAYADSLGIPARSVAAFGDMPNDLAMLEWAGHPHVMADSHADLDALPATRIGGNGESAVASTIAGWLR